MADPAYVKSFLGSFEEGQKRSLTNLFDYLLKSWRVGLPGHKKTAVNMAWVQLNVTTSTTANTEFTVAHGLGAAPNVLFPCLDLTSSGTQMVTLVTSRAADKNFLYLRSATAGAPITLFVESK